MSYEKISFELKNKMAYIGFGHNCSKSMTVLDEETLKELDSIIDEVAEKSSELDALIFFSHKEKCFLAGADIKLISSMKTESSAAHAAELGQLLYNKIDDLNIPTACCIHGVCLGGGTELALSCDKIFMSSSKSSIMGLPEVKLGLIPGFGGTFRMPRRIGLPKALDLILSGKTVNHKKAKRMGLADEYFAKERLLAMAEKMVLKKSEKNSNISSTLSHFASDNFLSRKIIYQKARESVLNKTKGFYQAPLKILDVMESGMTKGRSSYLASESQAFGELCISEQSKNLRHIFFMVEEGKKYSGPKGEGELPSFKQGATLGAGTMGGGIAWLMATDNMNPIMKDLNVNALELGLKQASSNFMGSVKRKKMSRDEFERKQRTISPQLGYKGFSRVDLVIEAVVENMDIKKKVFTELETKVSDTCVLTSNTSSLSIEEMAKAVEKSERFAGLHFFNPVHRMPLVEIISHSKVAPEVLESLFNWCLKVKKTPIIVKDGPGFLVNRILMAFLNEATYLLEEGVSIKDLDEACLNFGMPMGPCRLLDEVGIDVAAKASKIMFEGLGERAKAPAITEQLVEKDLLGRKTSKGFYHYDEKGKPLEINDEVISILSGKKENKMSEVEIQMRVFLPMINEAASCLQDEIVTTPADVDLSLIFGIGFPPFRGGLLKYADSEGLERILDALNKYAETVNEHRYKACDYLKNLVDNQKNFYD